MGLITLGIWRAIFFIFETYCPIIFVLIISMRFPENRTLYLTQFFCLFFLPFLLYRFLFDFRWSASYSCCRIVAKTHKGLDSNHSNPKLELVFFYVYCLYSLHFLYFIWCAILLFLLLFVFHFLWSIY